LYAEDPAAGWLPQSGRLHRFEIAGVGDGVRVDSGVESGSFVGVAYDPMLAKVIAHAPTRAEAAARLSRALSRSRIHGLRTNRDLLIRVLRDPVFLAGEATTAFLDNPSLLAAQAAPEVVELSAVAAARVIAAGVRDSGWRNVRSQPRSRAFQECTVEFEPEPADRPDRVVVQTGSIRRVFEVACYDDGLVEVGSSLGPVTLHRKPRFTPPSAALSAGSLVAPMPGTVVRVGVAVGDTVEKGQTVLWLEAMKMEHRVVAPADGVVTSLNASAGQQVQVGAVLAVVEGQ
jgi:propionyl-CoA carboxylase alpha chain